MEKTTQSFISTQDVESEVLIEPISNNKELKKAVESRKTRLSLWNDMLYNRQTGRVLREQMGHIAIAKLEAQKNDIIHQLFLAGDINKKKAFAVYQTLVSELNKKIIEESQRLTDQLNEMIHDNIVTIFERKATWTERINSMFSQKLLDENSKLKELKRMNRWIDRSLDELDDKSILFAKSHAETLVQTLELLDKRKIENAI